MGEPDRWITKNGKRIPIRGKRGGSGVVVLAGALVLGVALGSGGVLGGGGTATNPSVKADAVKEAKKGKTDEALRRLGMRRLKQTRDNKTPCVTASFGRVREFFLRTPCRSLDRILFAVADDVGNTSLVSVAWVGFRSRKQVGDFKRLIDVHGTGDIKPLGASLLGMADVKFTGRYYGSDVQGSTLNVAEAEAATGHTDPDILKTMAEVMAQLPRP